MVNHTFKGFIRYIIFVVYAVLENVTDEYPFIFRLRDLRDVRPVQPLPVLRGYKVAVNLNGFNSDRIS